jgi:DUF1680 family protein
VETQYPWAGIVRLEVEEAPASPYTLALRIPSWCRRTTLLVNDEPVPGDVHAGSYAEVRRTWQVGDAVELRLAVPARRVPGLPQVAATAGRVALARGPLVYCVEAADLPGVDVWTIGLADDAPLRAEAAPELLGGITLIRGEATRPGAVRSPVPLSAIPYYAWANRAPGAMQVWLHRIPPSATT